VVVEQAEDGNMNKIYRSSNPAFFFSKKEKLAIVEAIKEAEKNCSGEIRVHVAKSVKSDVIKEAIGTFEKIGMTKTKLRNGVLIFFAVKNRQFAIIGDKGINEKLGEDFWKDTAAEMEKFFKNGNFVEGMTYGIRRIGEILKTHFPYQRDDVNELPDEISISGKE